MKICHIITRLIVGGAQENTLLTCEGLRDLGHEVVLVAGPETGPEGSLWGRVASSGLSAITVDELRRAVSPGTDWRCLGVLRRVLTELGCDVVHTHSSKAGILGRLAARQAKTPLVVHTIHGMSFNRTQRWPTRALFGSMERWAGRFTDAIVSVADAMTEQAVAAGVAPRERFTTIYSGMDTGCFVPDEAARRRTRTEWGIPDSELVVGTISRLFRNKGYEHIIRAMPHLVRDTDSLRFVWVGDGKDRPVYERELARMGLRDRVHLTGLVPPERIPVLLAGFDILVHASRWEGLPRALPQALLMEVPVVSFDNDGAPEVVTPGVTGELVPLGDVLGLATAVTRLARSPEVRKRMGTEGRAKCLQMFDHRRMVARIDDLYERLNNEKSATVKR
jgi:glycosyltransferase involved in cell wall biosynthesis